MSGHRSSLKNSKNLDNANCIKSTQCIKEQVQNEYKTQGSTIFLKHLRPTNDTDTGHHDDWRHDHQHDSMADIIDEDFAEDVSH